MKETSTASSRSRRRQYRRQTAGSELLEVIRAIQELTLELAQLRHEECAGPELEAKDHTLEQLRWRLAALARRHATDDFGAVA